MPQPFGDHPSPSQKPSDSDAYDLAPMPAVPVAPPKQAAPTKQVQQPAIPRPLAYQSRRANGDKSQTDVDTLKKQTIPLWILIGGLAVESIVTALHARSSLQLAMMHLLLDIGLGTLLMTVGVLIAARFRNIEIGSLGTAILRLAAVVIAPDALSDILTPIAAIIPFGWIALLVIQFVIYFALLGAFFDLDESDTWYCVCVIFVINVAVYFGTMYLAGKK
jgi:hypothetical protein